jgi:hypothetical protein
MLPVDRGGFAMRRLLAAVLLSVAACGGDDGDFTYESASGDFGRYPPGGDPAENDDPGEGRPVEEADIFRFANQRLYVLNQYRGLYVFDVSDPDDPIELGRARLAGYPVEMYVRGGVVHAIVSDYFSYWREPGAEDEALEPVFGSRIVSIDLADPQRPITLGEVVLDGWVSDTRLVGDVIYAAANRYGPWTPGVPEGETADETIVTSIDVSSGAPVLVERLVLSDTSGWVTASAEAFVIAGDRWDETTWDVDTEITWVDISSPDGLMALRGERILDGQLREDTALDLRNGQLRVLTRDWESAMTRLTILDATQPDLLPTLGTLDYEYDGSLFGTTFADDRLYMVHYMRIDPLEVVDLSNPAYPFVAGILEMPGWVERIAALGDRLIGLGVDDTEGWRIALSLFDVSDPSEPALLDRITSGEDWSWSTALWERKAWLVDADEGLVLFPYSGWSDGATVYRHALGIVEFDDQSLTPRGEVQAPAPVERGALYEDRVYAISLAALQVVDVRDREQPVATATVELARHVAGYRRGAMAGVELAQSGLDYWYGAQGDSYLRLTPLDAPDGPVELARIVLPRRADGLLLDGRTAIAVRGWDMCRYLEDAPMYGCEPNEAAGVVLVDVTDVHAPAIVANLDFPAAPPLPIELTDRAWTWSWWLGSYGGPLGGGPGEPALALGDGRFAWIRMTSIQCNDALACAALGIEPAYVSEDGSWAYGWKTTNTLAILDVAAAEFVEEIELLDGALESALARDGLVAVTIAQPSRIDDEGRIWVRSMLERIYAGDLGVVRLTPVNIPGVATHIDADGGRALTVDRQWIEIPERMGTGMEVSLVAIDLGEAGATVTSRLELGEAIASLSADDERAWAVQDELVTIDVGDRDDLQVVASQPLGDGWWWIVARTATTLVLGGGYDGGLALFDLAEDPDEPAFLRYVRTLGWMTSVLQDGGTLYIVGGPYGIQSEPVSGTIE